MPQTTPPGAPSCPGPFGGARLQYPVSFELRIIYVLAEGATVELDALRLLGEANARCGTPSALPAPGVKYGRLSIPVTFSDEASMHAAYAGIGALPCVKAVL